MRTVAAAVTPEQDKLFRSKSPDTVQLNLEIKRLDNQVIVA